MSIKEISVRERPGVRDMVDVKAGLRNPLISDEALRKAGIFQAGSFLDAEGKVNLPAPGQIAHELQPSYISSEMLTRKSYLPEINFQLGIFTQRGRTGTADNANITVVLPPALEKFKTFFTTGLSSKDDVLKFLKVGSKYSPLLAHIKKIIDDDPEILEHVYFVNEKNVGATYRTGAAMADRNLPAHEILLSKNDSPFVFVHEMAHYLPLDILKSYLPSNFQFPEVDPNADILSIAKALIGRMFADEAIAAIFEINLANDIAMRGLPFDLAPDYVWQSKEVFDSDGEKFFRSYVYLGDNHKNIYPIVVALKMADIIKTDPKRLTELKWGKVDLAELGSKYTLAEFVKKHKAEIDELMRFLAEFFDGDQKIYLGDPSKFERYPQELHDAVIVAGDALRRLEMSLAQTQNRELLNSLANSAASIILCLTGKRLARALSLLFTRGREMKMPNLTDIAQHILAVKGYGPAQKESDNAKVSGNEQLEWGLISNDHFRKLTGLDLPRVIMYKAVTYLNSIADVVRTANEALFAASKQKRFRLRDDLEGRFSRDNTDLWIDEYHAIIFDFLTVSCDIITNDSLSPTEKDTMVDLFKLFTTPHCKDLTTRAYERVVEAFRAFLDKDAEKMRAILLATDVNIYMQLYIHDASLLYTPSILIMDLYLILKGNKISKEDIEELAEAFYEHVGKFDIYNSDYPDSAFFKILIRTLAKKMDGATKSTMIKAFFSLIPAPEEMEALAIEYFIKAYSAANRETKAFIKEIVGSLHSEAQLTDESMNTFNTAIRAPDKANIRHHSAQRKKGDQNILKPASNEKPIADSKKTEEINLPDITKSSDDEIDAFLKAWEESLLSNQPLIRDFKNAREWIIELASEGKKDAAIYALDICLDYITMGFDTNLKQWVGLVNAAQIDAKARDHIFESAVSALFFTDAEHASVDQKMAVLYAADILAPAILKPEYPNARKAFFGRLKNLAGEGTLEAGSVPQDVYRNFLTHFLIPLVELHPEMVTEAFLKDFQRLGDEDDAQYKTNLNKLFADSISSLDHTTDISQWDTSLIDYGTMDADGTEEALLNEISRNAGNLEYPAERAQKLESALKKMLRFRLNEYLILLGKDVDADKAPFSDADLKEIPLLNFLYFAVDEKDAQDAYADSKVTAEGITPPNPWDYLEDGVPLSPVQKAAFKAVLNADSTTEARMKAAIFLEVLGFDDIDNDLRQMAVEGLLLAGLGTTYIYKYYQNIKDDAHKLTRLGEWLIKFRETNGLKTINDYDFSTLLLFAKNGIEKDFWTIYRHVTKMIRSERQISLREPKYLYFLPGIFDNIRIVYEAEAPFKFTKLIGRMAFVYEFYVTLEKYFSARLANPGQWQPFPSWDLSPVARACIGNLDLDSISRMPLKKMASYKELLKNPILHYVMTRRKITDNLVDLPDAIKEMPKLVKFFFAEYWMKLTPLEKGRLGKLMDEKLEGKGEAASLKAFLEAIKLEKLGQIIFTLYGIVPDDWRVEFRTFLEENKPASFYEVREIIERDFEKPLDKIFSHFSEDPIAVGSIAQVHEAYTNDGRRVAVKVIIPARKVALERTLKTLNSVVREYEVEKRLFDVPLNITDFYQWFINSMAPEFDLTLEKENARLFRWAAGSEVKLPIIYKATKNVMVMDYVEMPDGEARLNPADTEIVITSVLRALLKGVVHDDPHPGNIAGKTLFDFGRIEMLSVDERMNLIEFFAAIYVAAMSHIMAEPSQTKEAADKLIASIRKLSGNNGGASHPHLEKYLSSKDFADAEFNGDLLTELLKQSGYDGLALKPKMYAVIKVLITLDELGRSVIGADFSLAQHLSAIAAEAGGQFEEIPKDLMPRKPFTQKSYYEEIFTKDGGKK